MCVRFNQGGMLSNAGIFCFLESAYLQNLGRFPLSANISSVHGKTSPQPACVQVLKGKDVYTYVLGLLTTPYLRETRVVQTIAPIYFWGW